MRHFHVLFLCTGNSCRSQMAEAILNHRYAGRFHAFSAGSAPDIAKHKDTNGVHPLALRTLQKNGIPTEGLFSKSWDPFIRGADEIDFVFTLCGDAKHDMEEACPVFPGRPMSAHWGLEDPAKAAGSPEEVERIFQEAFRIIRHRIDLFASLPMETLDRNSLKKRADEIGTLE